MKNLLSLFIVGSLLFISACTKTCEAGYEGKDCKTEIRSKFYGDYKGLLNKDNQNTQVVFDVSAKSDNVEKIQVGIFEATLQGKNGDFYLETQSYFYNGLDYTAYGNGAFDGKTLTLLYYIERNGTTSVGYFTGIRD